MAVTREDFVALERKRLVLVGKHKELIALEDAQNGELTEAQLEQLEALRPEFDALNDQVADLVAAYDAEIQAVADAKRLATVALLEPPRQPAAPEQRPAAAAWDRAIAQVNGRTQ